MRVLATGASGMVGAAVVERPSERGHHVVPALRSLRGADVPPGGEKIEVDSAKPPTGIGGGPA